MSGRGYCSDCAAARQKTALLQIAEHRGPHFDHWRRQMAACVGGALVDAPQHER